MLINNVLLSIIFILSLYCAVCDIKKRTIKNNNIVVIALLCSFFAITNNEGNIYFIQAITIIIIGILLTLSGVLGAADSKLLAAYSLSIEPDILPLTLLSIPIIGGLQIIIMFLIAKFENKAPFKNGIPYAIPITFCGFISLFLS
ncbi:prepilin peptidase [Photobacterium proteolyticum]|nr:prepilin peptidase [Photobacterium proteolyticum]